jgi:hypothetical protein
METPYLIVQASIQDKKRDSSFEVSKTKRDENRVLDGFVTSFCTSWKPSISSLKTLNSNAFRSNLLVLNNGIFLVYMSSANLISKQTILQY